MAALWGAESHVAWGTLHKSAVTSCASGTRLHSASVWTASWAAQALVQVLMQNLHFRMQGHMLHVLIPA